MSNRHSPLNYMGGLTYWGVLGQTQREGVGDTTTFGFDPVLSNCSTTVINADSSHTCLKAANVFTLHWKAVSHDS